MKQTFPFALLISLMMIYARIDGVMLEKILGEQGSREAGLYASAFRLIDAFNQFGYLFAVLLLPIFSRMISSGQKVEDLAKSSFTVIHAGAMIACSGTLFYASEIMDLLYHEPGEYPAAILRILIFTVLGSTATFVFSTLLTAANHLGILSGAAGFAAVVNFGLNLFLIPRNQALGAAEAAAVTQISLGAFHLLLAAYYFRFQVNYPLVIRFIVFAASCIFIFWMLHQAPISWYLSLAAGSAACLLVAFLVKVFEVNRMLSYIRADK